MRLYCLPFDIIQEAFLFLDVIDLKKLEIAGPKNQLLKEYLEPLSSNFTETVYFYGSRKIALPLDVYLKYLDQNFGLIDLVLKGGCGTAPEAYSPKFQATGHCLNYLCIPCENTLQERELLEWSANLQELRLFNRRMTEVAFHLSLDFVTVNSLDLSGCGVLRNFSDAMYGFRSLTSLNVSHCYDISDDFMISTLRVTKLLEVLNMNYCMQLTDVTLLMVMDLTAIKQLGVVNCLGFSVTTIQAVPQRCPNFIGFLEDKPLSSTSLGAPSKATLMYNVVLMPRLEALYGLIEPYKDTIRKVYFAIIFAKLGNPSLRSETWYRLLFIVMSFLLGLYQNFLTFMQKRRSRVWSYFCLGLLGFSVTIFIRSLWFLYWDIANSTKASGSENTLVNEF